MGDLLERASNALAVAREVGIPDLALTLERSRSVEVTHRDGALETLQESTQMALTATLFVDGRYSSSTTCDLRPDALRSFLGRAADLTRLLAPDPHRGLAEPALYEGQTGEDLQLEDRDCGGLDADRAASIASRVQTSAADHEGVISSTGTAVESRSESALVTSNGFAGEERGTAFWFGAQVTVADGDDRRPAGSSWAASLHRSGLPDPDEVGQEALERALLQRGARPVSTVRCAMVLENAVGRRLLSALIGPLSGQALQQRRSFLEGRQGHPVASEHLTLTDDPWIPGGLGSRRFDGEGIAARPRPIVERGVLRDHFLDTYYARKLGRKPTGGSPSNLVVEPGSTSFADILEMADRGILVTSLLGGNSDPTTGDYSFGIQGHRIEGGAIAEPVSEMNITGALPGLMERLTVVGDDPYPYAAMLVPTLTFADVQFSGL